MIEIKVNPAHIVGIQNNDLRVIKQVVKENSEINAVRLKNAAKFEDFRFYQGVAQTLDGLIKILP